MDPSAVSQRATESFHMTAEEINALFDRRANALAARDAVALAALYTDNAIVESPTYGTLVGRPAIERGYDRWFTAFPDILFDEIDRLIERNRVVLLGTMGGTDTGGFLGQDPTGKPYRSLV